MLKINKELEKLLSEINGVGYFSELGAIIGDDEFILYRPENSNEIFLSHISEFEQSGVLVRLKESDETLVEVIDTPRTITIKRCSACGLDHEDIEIGEYHMTLVYIEGNQITHWATCPKTGRNIDIAIDKSNKSRCTNYLSK